MKTNTIMGSKAKQYMATAYVKSEYGISRARISVSGTTHQPIYPGQLIQARTVGMFDSLGGSAFLDGTIHIKNDQADYGLMWVFPDGVGAAGSTITIQLYSGSYTPQIGINIAIEGGLPSGVLYMENMAIVFQGDE